MKSAITGIQSNVIFCRHAVHPLANSLLRCSWSLRSHGCFPLQQSLSCSVSMMQTGLLYAVRATNVEQLVIILGNKTMHPLLAAAFRSSYSAGATSTRLRGGLGSCRASAPFSSGSLRSTGSVASTLRCAKSPALAAGSVAFLPRASYACSAVVVRALCC
jgi:hypothetical protein